MKSLLEYSQYFNFLGSKKLHVGHYLEHMHQVCKFCYLFLKVHFLTYWVQPSHNSALSFLFTILTFIHCKDMLFASSKVQRLLTMSGARAFEGLFSWKIRGRLGSGQKLKSYEEAEHLETPFGTILCWSNRRQQYFYQYH